MKNKRLKKKSKYIASYLIIFAVLLFVLLPIYIMVITSVTSTQEANNAEFSWWPKEGVTVSGYRKAFTNNMGGITLLGSFVNTIWIYVPGLIVGMLVSALSGYAFAKMQFPGKNLIFAILIATMTIPNSMSMISNFLIYDFIGWINTPYPLMVPPMFGVVTVVFFLRQYISGIPSDLISAAKIDGLEDFGCFLRIILPISVPALVAQFILQFIVSYNDYLNPLLFLQDAHLYTLQIALAFFTDAYIQDWPLRMAGCVIALIPVLIMYFVAQKYILRGVAVSGAIKG